MYKELDVKLNIKNMEKKISQFWQENKIFEKSVIQNKEEHIFYDGPPFPTGSPHYGTVFVSILKDAVARFWTMKGKSVPRAWGWDCHGLPIENAVEKKLQIEDKQDIEKTIGIKAFNDACRELVSGYNDAWEEYINRIGRWVDYKNPYRTLDLDYMESTIWVFSECYKKGLIYKDYRVTPYCYHCETSLSISDTRESDSTRPRQDPAIIVKFRTEEDYKNKPCYYLAWTTTPWTLPANLALAVGRNINYVVADTGDECFILAEELFNKNFFPDNTIFVKHLKGHELEGKKYHPLFPYYKDSENAFQILLSDHVSIDDGVGIVHIAPAFGEDDYWVSRKNNVKIKNPVLSNGVFNSDVSDFEGMNVHEANPHVIHMLKEKNKLFHHSTIVHNYPHCWRCRTPLIYRAMDAWYFNIEKIKPQLIEQNKHINWVPENVKAGRFGKWLEGGRDWNLSRNRYWGTPIPVWICNEPGCGEEWVPSSSKEIENRTGSKINDLHIENIDDLSVKCSCGGLMKRTPEVLDGWFESGAMPFGQCHYPFENKDWFESHFPADFIIEYPGQIRGWFYYLHVLAVAILGRPAFKNCLVHGTLLASDGQKLSKSRNNYTDPLSLLDQYGADSLRLYLINSSASVFGDMKFVDEDVRAQTREVIIPLLNVVSFFVTYGNIDSFKGDPYEVPVSLRGLDQWLLARLSQTISNTTKAYEEYKMNEVLPPVLELIKDISSWYIRRSRELFWEEGMSEKKQTAYKILYFAILQTVKLLAPAIPFLSEYLFHLLANEESVHLSSWPGFYLTDKDELLNKVKLTQKIASLGLSLRQSKRVKVRQPLSSIKICLPEDLQYLTLEESILKDELNVKDIKICHDFYAAINLC